MKAQVAARLAALQQATQQTQQALAALEQERQGLLQQLIGQQHTLGVLQAVLDEARVQDAAAQAPQVAPHLPWDAVAP